MFKVVALKQLKLTAVKSDDGFPSSSLREISLLLEIQHPNVVRCREVARSSAFAYLYGYASCLCPHFCPEMAICRCASCFSSCSVLRRQAFPTPSSLPTNAWLCLFSCALLQGYRQLTAAHLHGHGVCGARVESSPFEARLCNRRDEVLAYPVAAWSWAFAPVLDFAPRPQNIQYSPGQVTWLKDRDGPRFG